MSGLKNRQLWVYRKSEYLDKPELYSMPLSRPTAEASVKRAKKSDDMLASLAHWVMNHQAGIAFNLIALVFLSHTLPKARPYTTKFFTLSYYNPDTDKYAIGFDDCYFTIFCTVLFSGLRAACMDHVLAPLARSLGLANSKAVTRFTEQAWLPVYYSVFWTMGVYIWYTSPYFLNLRELWTDWPSRELDGLMKGYYLAQWAFWLQQVVVLHIEKRRKDHWQMLTHHFVTIALVATSYGYHFTRVGNLILIIMDIIDIIFPLAKCTKYLGYTTICDGLFVLFVVVWLATRHIFYLLVVYSAYIDLPREIPPVCYRGPASNLEGPLPTPSGWGYLLEPFLDPRGLICFNWNILSGFLTYLLSLQVMMIMWSFFIVRIVVRVLSGGSAEDPRSEDEEEEEEEEGDEADEEADGKPDHQQLNHSTEKELKLEAKIDLMESKIEQGAGDKISSSSGIALPAAAHSKYFRVLERITRDKQVRVAESETQVDIPEAIGRVSQ